MARSLWLFVLAAIIANAQEISGSIAGIVTDGTGGILANAEVVSTHTETGVARSMRTTTEGQFTLASLSIGGYTLDVTPPVASPPGSPTSPQLHHRRGRRRYHAKQFRRRHRHTRRASVTVCIETLFLSETRNPWQSTNSANPLKV